MSKALSIIRASHAIRQTVTHTVFTVREFSGWIEDEIAGGGWASSGAMSEIDLATAAHDIEEMGKSLIWLAKGLEKRRFDLLQAGQAHNVVMFKEAAE
jgi:hypothetical protein